MKERYKGALVADIARLAGLNDDLTCDIWHPRNAPYRVPLPNSGDEDTAVSMASVIVGAVAEKHADDPAFDSDKAFEQALIDSRRMLCELGYSRLFGSGPESLDDISATSAELWPISIHRDLMHRQSPATCCGVNHGMR